MNVLVQLNNTLISEDFARDFVWCLGRVTLPEEEVGDDEKEIKASGMALEKETKRETCNYFPILFLTRNVFLEPNI